MNNDVIRSQFHAALSMMQQAVEECPASLWNRAEDKNKYWQVAYHALFYTHLYLQPTLEEFVPWSGHLSDSEDLSLDQSLDDVSTYARYTKDDVLNYIIFCRQQVDDLVPALDLNAGSGFHWLPMSKAELQFYSLRHLQTHIGELAERFWAAAGIEIDWVGKGI